MNESQLPTQSFSSSASLWNPGRGQEGCQDNWCHCHHRMQRKISRNRIIKQQPSLVVLGAKNQLPDVKETCSHRKKWRGQGVQVGWPVTSTHPNSSWEFVNLRLPVTETSTTELTGKNHRVNYFLLSLTFTSQARQAQWLYNWCPRVKVSSLC